MTKYIFFSTKSDYYRIAYSDLLILESVVYLEDAYLGDGHLDFLYRYLYYNLKLNLVNRFFKKYFCYRCLSKLNYSEAKCFFIFNERTVSYFNFNLHKEIKARFPNAVIISFYQDLVTTVNNIGIYDVKLFSDFVLSYSRPDCVNFNLIFRNTPYSFLKFSSKKSRKSDFLFVGSNKGRLKQLREIYDYLSAKNYTCEFYITNVDSIEIKKDGLHYNEVISYRELIEMVNNTRCIIDLVQSDQAGLSFRVWESIYYDKYLITNNKSLINSEYYFRDSMFVCQNAIDLANFIFPDASVCYPESLKCQISPIFLLDFLKTL